MVVKTRLSKETDQYLTSGFFEDLVEVIRQQLVRGGLQHQTTPTDSPNVSRDTGFDESPRFDAVLSAVEDILRRARTQGTASESEPFRMSDFSVAEDDVEDDFSIPIPPKLQHIRVRRLFEAPRGFEAVDGEDDSLLE